jgi:hypothetical protein
VFLAVITDRVIAVIRQHILPQDAQSAWAPLGRTAIAGLRLAAVVALYLLRVLLAPSETLRGLRRMILDAAPVPEVTRPRPVSGEPLSCAVMITGSRSKGPDGRPRMGTPPRAAARTMIGTLVSLLRGSVAFLVRYRSHPGYGDRSAAGRVAAELAPLAGLQAGTGRTYIAEELRKLTKLALSYGSVEEDDGQSAG